MKFRMSSACIGAILAGFINVQGSSALTCTASVVDGFPEPDHPEVTTTTHLICTTDDGQVINIDGSREEILSRYDFYSGPHQTQLSLPSEILLEDSEGMDGMYVHLNRETLDKIYLINQPKKSPRSLQTDPSFPSRLGTEYDKASPGVVPMPGATPYVIFNEDEYVTYDELDFGTSGTTKSILITYMNANMEGSNKSGYFMELRVDGPGGPVEIGEFVPPDKDGLYVSATTYINIDDVVGMNNLTFAGRGGNVGMSIYEFRLSSTDYSSENDYQISLIDGSIDVAFNNSRLDKEITMNLNITTGNIDDLSNPIKVFDYDTCNTTEYDSAMLVASANTNAAVPDASTDDFFSAVPAEIDFNTTDIVSYNNIDTYPGFFNTQDEYVVLQFCLKPTLGSSNVERNGTVEESYISYTKIKVQITLNMTMDFSTAKVAIKEDSPTVITQDSDVDYTLEAYECDAATKLRIAVPSVKSQNSQITICIESTFDDIIVGSIKELTLTQSSSGLISKAIDDSVSNSITEVSRTGTAITAVTTRLVGAFFTDLEDTPSEIDIEGIAVLEFVSGTRKLVHIGNSEQVSDRALGANDDQSGEFAVSVDISNNNDALNSATQTKRVLFALVCAIIGSALVL